MPRNDGRRRLRTPPRHITLRLFRDDIGTLRELLWEAMDKCREKIYDQENRSSPNGNAIDAYRTRLNCYNTIDTKLGEQLIAITSGSSVRIQVPGRRPRNPRRVSDSNNSGFYQQPTTVVLNEPTQERNESTSRNIAQRTVRMPENLLPPWWELPLRTYEARPGMWGEPNPILFPLQDTDNDTSATPEEPVSGSETRF